MVRGAAVWPTCTLPGLWAFFAGTIGTEFASKALQITVPLLLLKLSGTAAAVGFIVALAALFDMGGTLLGGWLSRWIPARALLVYSTAIRSIALAAIPLLLSTSWLTLEFASLVYIVDGVARGVGDTARYIVPIVLAGKDRKRLGRVNSRYQIALEVGSVAGAFLTGFLLVGPGEAAANWVAPIAFLAATAAYALVRAAEPRRTREGPEESAATLRRVGALLASSPMLFWPFLGIVLLTLYPLKGLVPALFAESILQAPEKAAWLVGIFSLGAVAGSLAYDRLCARVRPAAWLVWSAVGVLVFAVSWTPGTFAAMAVGVTIFASTNVTARLSLMSALQSEIPQEANGAFMGLTRFSVNLASVAVRAMVGVAFALAASALQAFALLGVGLGAFAAMYLAAARALAASPAFERPDPAGGQLVPSRTASGATR